jgi:hypothetical protein
VVSRGNSEVEAKLKLQRKIKPKNSLDPASSGRSFVGNFNLAG